MYPQKVSRRLADQKLRIGITIEELIGATIVPTICNFLGLDFVISLIIFGAVLIGLILKNFVFEKGQIGQLIKRRKRLYFEKVHYDSKN